MAVTPKPRAIEAVMKVHGIGTVGPTLRTRNSPLGLSAEAGVWALGFMAEETGAHLKMSEQATSTECNTGV